MKSKPVLGPRQHLHSPDYANKDALYDGEIGLPRYNRSIVKSFANYFGLQEEGGASKSKILEFGAGSGTLTEIFKKEYGIAPVCIEIDQSLVKILKSKDFTVYQNLDELRNKFSFVYTSNVLEHIEDDLKALSDIAEVVQLDGHLAIYVPALPFLFSDLDRKAGHFRRYTRKELIKKVEAAGFLVEKCFYNDSLGVPASMLIKLFGYRNRSKIGSIRSLVLYDRLAYPISRFLDQLGLKFILGKNLYLFAKRGIIPRSTQTLNGF
jgi:SAM-dependent methyltransferase